MVAVKWILYQLSAYYIEEFIAHYKKLGVKHFFFLDNNSTDNTIEKLKMYQNVSIFKTGLSYKLYWNLFKKYLFEKFGNSGWNLLVDIDEFFDFPFSNEIGLQNLIHYLNTHKYEAVVTQMLDLFPKESYNDSLNLNFIDSHKYYDNTSLEKRNYYDEVLYNIISNPNIKFFVGGARKKIFNLDNLFLTKHALIKHQPHISYFHDHFPYNARVADVSALLLHYKFHNNFKNYITEAIETKVHWNESYQYKKYKEVFDENDNIEFFNKDCLEFSDANNLIVEEFLVVSEKYMNFVKNLNSAKNVDYSKYAKIVQQQNLTGDALEKESQVIYHKLLELNEKIKKQQRLLEVMDDQKRALEMKDMQIEKANTTIGALKNSNEYLLGTKINKLREKVNSWMPKRNK